MLASVNPAAGTQSIQSSAVKHQTQSLNGSAPTSAPTTARSRAQANVDKLFQLTAGLSAELHGRLDSAEAKRVEGAEGISTDRVQQSLAQIKESVEAIKTRGPTLTQAIDKLTAEVEQAVTSGRGSNDRIAEVVQQTQAAMAERYGYVGHLLNTTA